MIRAMAVLAVTAAITTVIACGSIPSSGYACGATDQTCPTGLSCVGGVCVTDAASASDAATASDAASASASDGAAAGLLDGLCTAAGTCESGTCQFGVCVTTRTNTECTASYSKAVGEAAFGTSPPSPATLYCFKACTGSTPCSAGMTCSNIYRAKTDAGVAAPATVCISSQFSAVDGTACTSGLGTCKLNEHFAPFFCVNGKCTASPG